MKQISLFNEDEKMREQRRIIKFAIDNIRRRCGYNSMMYATLPGNLKLPPFKDCELTIPKLIV